MNLQNRILLKNNEEIIIRVVKIENSNKNLIKDVINLKSGEVISKSEFFYITEEQIAQFYHDAPSNIIALFQLGLEDDRD